MEVNSEFEQTAPCVEDRSEGRELDFDVWAAPEPVLSRDAPTVVLRARSRRLLLRLPGRRGALRLGAVAALGLGLSGGSLLLRARSDRHSYARGQAMPGHRVTQAVRVPRPVDHMAHPFTGATHWRAERTLRVSIRRRSHHRVSHRASGLPLQVSSAPVRIRPGNGNVQHAGVVSGRAPSASPRPARVQYPCLPGTLGC
jgi:hypothetical protein